MRRVLAVKGLVFIANSMLLALQKGRLTILRRFRARSVLEILCSRLDPVGFLRLASLCVPKTWQAHSFLRFAALQNHRRFWAHRLIACEVVLQCFS